jgi:uncharacterized protein
MAKAESSQDQTVEEILASIRHAISADDSKRIGEAAEPKSDPPKLMHERRPGFPPAQSLTGATREPPKTAAPQPPTPADRSQMHDVIEHAIEQALDSVGDGQAPSTAPGQAPRMITPPPRPPMRPGASPRPQVEPHVGRELPRPSPPTPQRPSLLSPRTNAAVSMSFEDLSKAIAANTGRGLDQTVDEVLRPMLRTWLDDNLPALVERLVREEIERVSRGRR